MSKSINISSDNLDFFVYGKYIDKILDFIPLRIGWKIMVFKSNLRWWLKCRYQKFKNGVCDDDVYDLQIRIAKFIVPRLIYFKNIGKKGVPFNFVPANYSDLSEEEMEIADQKAIKEWNETLDKMIFAFDYIINEEKYIKMPDVSKFYGSDDEWLRSLGTDREKNPEEEKMWYDYFEKCKELQKRHKEGMNLFAEHYENLWI